MRVIGSHLSMDGDTGRRGQTIALARQCLREREAPPTASQTSLPAEWQRPTLGPSLGRPFFLFLFFFLEFCYFLFYFVGYSDGILKADCCCC